MSKPVVDLEWAKEKADEIEIRAQMYDIVGMREVCVETYQIVLTAIAEDTENRDWKPIVQTVLGYFWGTTELPPNPLDSQRPW
jgi:hypothetical protein